MRLRTLIGLAVLSSVTATASALTWVDRDPNSGNGPLSFLYESYPNDNKAGSNLHYYGNFNILDDGYDPNMHVITGVRASFAFADDRRNEGSYGSSDTDYREEVDIFMGHSTVLGEVQIANDMEVNGDHTNAPTSYDWRNFNLSGNGTILSDLQNGAIAFRVSLDPNYSNWTRGREDTYLKIAKLTVYGEKKTVPESGATLSMMGLALLGLVSLRHRCAK